MLNVYPRKGCIAEVPRDGIKSQRIRNLHLLSPSLSFSCPSPSPVLVVTTPCELQGSDADIVVWNPQNVRTVSQKTSQHATNFNVYEGVTLHGAPEFVLSQGKIVVAEYQVSLSPALMHVFLIPPPS